MSTKWVHFRIDDELHERIRAAAIADRRSVSNWLALILERALADEADDPEARTPTSPTPARSRN